MRKNLYQQILDTTALDIHTHVNPSHPTARGLHDIFLYHMVISDLYSAGCPSGERLSDNPSDQEAEQRIVEAIPYIPHIRNTSIYNCMRMILRDLYGVEAEITLENWREIDKTIRAKSKDYSWAREVLSRARVEQYCTEYAHKADTPISDLTLYSMEWAFFVRTQWNFKDAPILELEWAWNSDVPQTPLPIRVDERPKVSRVIRTRADVDAAIAHYIDKTPFDQIISSAHFFSTDIDYRPVTDEEMDRALQNRPHAADADQDIYASYIFERFLDLTGQHRKGSVVQFATGAEPLPFETGMKLRSETVFQIAQMASRHLDVNFLCMNAAGHQNQAMCTLARELPNYYLAGYWWHSFFPSVIETNMGERLDMISTARNIGFFTDAYCLDWVYGKSMLIRRILAKVLSQKIDDGIISDEATALDIAKRSFYDSSAALFGIGTPHRKQ